MSNQDDLKKPEGLSPKGEAAHAAIMAVLDKHNATYTGGCKAFYNSSEWADRGERYGHNSALIVVYDGGDLRRFFSMDAALDWDLQLRREVHHPYACYEEMQAALLAVGCYFEECTGWHCAVYPAEQDSDIPRY